MAKSSEAITPPPLDQQAHTPQRLRDIVYVTQEVCEHDGVKCFILERWGLGGTLYEVEPPSVLRQLRPRLQQHSTCNVGSNHRRARLLEQREREHPGARSHIEHSGAVSLSLCGCRVQPRQEQSMPAPVLQQA
jgi:hypothetical protein